MTNKTLFKISSWIVSLAIICSFGNIVKAQTANPAFNANRLIEDNIFSDNKTFGGPDGIQKFLSQKGSILADTSPEFLSKLKEPSAASLKTTLEDPQPNLGRLRTAAELIWDASQSSGLNPQVILVILNKEQGLITASNNISNERLQRMLDFSLGFGCPVSTGCTGAYPGFYYQLFGNVDTEGNRYLGSAASLMRSFNTPGGRGPLINGRITKIGDTITVDNTTSPYNPPALQDVILTNSATAALYRYTPHVFNGNYNFWRYFNEWFKYPNGTLLNVSGDNRLYIIQNGGRFTVPSFVATARSLNPANAITVSQNEIGSYELIGTLGPADNTVAQLAGQTQLYVFQNNVRYPASAFVINQRGLANQPKINISQDEATLFPEGALLPPADGTVIRGIKSPAVYLVNKGKLQLYSALTFSQYNVGKKIQIVPEEEIPLYPKQGFVPPLNGSLIRTAENPTVYLVEEGLKRGLTAELFKNRGLSFKQLVIISSDEMNALASGGIAAPKDLTYFQSLPGKELYLYKSGAKHRIYGFVANQRKISADFSFDEPLVKTWEDGLPIPPKDNTVLKSDTDSTVYIVLNGQLKPLSYEAFVNRGLAGKPVSVLPAAEINSFGLGDLLTQ